VHINNITATYQGHTQADVASVLKDGPCDWRDVANTLEINSYVHTRLKERLPWVVVTVYDSHSRAEASMYRNVSECCTEIF
jgi:hypothetical protein